MRTNHASPPSPLDQLERLGIELPPVPTAVASYVPAIRTGSTVLTSGQLPFVDGALPITGRLGDGVTTAEGHDLARIATLNALAAAHAAVGLGQIQQVVRVAGYVASADGFTEQASVVDGASQLLQDVFGETGRHVRTAVGVAWLPLGAPVELEIHLEVAS